jgi:murein peptide amidase A
VIRLAHAVVVAVTAIVFGHSVQGRPLHAIEVGDPASAHRVLVVGCIHGDECAALPLVRRLERAHPRFDLWLVPTANPDGLYAGTRQNADGVDLNRNFPSEWIRIGRRGDPQYSGPRPLSEPETRALRALVLRLRPAVTIWFHQPQAIVRAWGHSIPPARRFARAAGMPFRSLRWPNGTAPNWQNHRFATAASFVVELPPGPLRAPLAKRLRTAVLGE